MPTMKKAEPKKKLPPVLWMNPKYKNRVYLGKYEMIKKKDGESKRCLVLSYKMKNGKMHEDVFESHEDAKTSGWYKAN